MRFNSASGIVRLVAGLAVLGVGITCGASALRDGTAPEPPAPWTLTADGTAPEPPAPWLVADGTAPEPPAPWLVADGTAPEPPAPWVVIA
jgi:hypothetical protein